jgi:DNA replication and repair protein RecF
MILRRLGLRNFRNIEEANLEFDSGNTFLFGLNGHGKSNLLEAIGFMTAMRAFRTNDQQSLIRYGEDEASMVYELEHEKSSVTHLTIRLGSNGRSVEVDAVPVRKLADVIGQFPTVVFASEDIQLIRSGPAFRRRQIDLFLSGLDSEYFVSLIRYHRSLRARNALLKQEAGDEQLGAFEQVMAPLAVKLSRARLALVTALDASLFAFYSGLSGGCEKPKFHYRPDVSAVGASEWVDVYRSSRLRDRQLRSTQKGPHRDDFRLLLEDRDAQEFASEGQQRGLVLAFRFAQLETIRKRRGVAPIILADDVLGELDSERRERFWSHLGSDTQVIATGTRPPGSEGERSWSVFSTDAGNFRSETYP